MSVYTDDADDGVLLDLNSQVGPFGATVNGALGFLTDATLLGQHPAPNSPNRGVTRLQAFKWLQEYTGRVTIAIGGTERIVDNLGSLVGPVYITCKDLVQLATAARIEAARGRPQYAEQLWARYTASMDELKAYLNVKLGADVAASTNGILHNFPRTHWQDWGQYW